MPLSIGPDRFIFNRISECVDGKKRKRGASDLQYIIIHRIGPTIGKDGPEIARWFRQHPIDGHTNGEMPYHLIIREDGVTEQCVELFDSSPHAARYNMSGIGIACIGDFRFSPPTREQLESLVTACALLQNHFKFLSIIGHTDLRGASHDPNKICPGKFIVMQELRERAKERLLTIHSKQLIDEGFVL